MEYRADQKMGPLLFASDARGSSEGDFGAYGITVSHLSAKEAEVIMEVGEAPTLSVCRADGTLSRKLGTPKHLVPTAPTHGYQIILPKKQDGNMFIVESGNFRTTSRLERLEQL